MKFPESRVKHLCKADLFMFTDVISDVHFMPDGVELCASACETYKTKMNIDPGVMVTPINSNCAYIGETVLEEHPANKTQAAKCANLSTT